MHFNLSSSKKILVLTGGVGGAKLCYGLSQILPPESLLFVVNTGDDFEYMGLPICPDIDTLLYRLSNLNDRERGWGRSSETWMVMDALKALKVDPWFALGDKDLALHLLRSFLYKRCDTLTEVTDLLCKRLNLEANVVPMSDQLVATRLKTSEGDLSFQEYFVQRACKPKVEQIYFDGVNNAQLNPKVKELFEDDALECIIVCPSNPWLSINPMLSIPEFSYNLKYANVPVIAVSPLINGKALKGPTTKIMKELGLNADVYQVAKFYEGIVNKLVLDPSDSKYCDAIQDLGMETQVTNVFMGQGGEGGIRLAEDLLRTSSFIIE